MNDLYEQIMQMVGAIPKIKPWKPTTMPPQQEQQFQQDITNTPWYQEFVKKYGEAPNLNDPNYDYRGAWRAGVGPNQRNPVDQMMHWSDRTPQGQWLKSPYHPTAWANPFIDVYGINPDELSPQDPRVKAFSELWQKNYPPRY